MNVPSEQLDFHNQEHVSAEAAAAAVPMVCAAGSPIRCQIRFEYDQYVTKYDHIRPFHKKS